MLSKAHFKAVEDIINSFESAGYDVSYKLLNANDFEVPQDRQRVFFIGFRNDLGIKIFVFQNLFTINPL
jgi:DNA (cytosine-5)-methyltransferase 1